MKRIFLVLGYALAGLAVALVLTVGAFALAGQEISEPAGPPIFTPSPEPTPDAERSPEGGERSPDEDRTRSPEPEHSDSTSPPVVDDHGVDSGDPGSGSDSDSGDQVDSSGSETGEDHDDD